MSKCPLEVIDLARIGVDINAICDSHAADLILAIADHKNLPVPVLTPRAVLEVCEETYLGIHADHREELLMHTMSELDRRDILDTYDHAGIIDAMQDVAARHQFANVDCE